jgi:hypothetical protein
MPAGMTRCCPEGPAQIRNYLPVAEVHATVERVPTELIPDAGRQALSGASISWP